MTGQFENKTAPITDGSTVARQAPSTNRRPHPIPGGNDPVDPPSAPR
jgi:hypothetical protein